MKTLEWIVVIALVVLLTLGVFEVLTLAIRDAPSCVLFVNGECYRQGDPGIRIPIGPPCNETNDFCGLDKSPLRKKFEEYEPRHSPPIRPYQKEWYI